MRRGFTLIEMLVSTALVMLIMLLFARIFEEAIGTVRAQRGLIANDERARAFTSALRSDLNDLTYRASVSRGASVVTRGVQESPRGVVALGPGDRPDPRQRGFLYFSENDPNDDGDDVLQMTVAIDETLRNPLISDPSFAPYQGRAIRLSEDADGDNTLDGNEDDGPTGAYPPDNGNGVLDIYPNQPDMDDGLANSAGGSRAAEVCWFLRGTTLYRSVKMLRDPLPNGSPPNDTQPTVFSTGLALLPTYAPFYRDFDYSATMDIVPGSPGNSRLHFHGLSALDNSLGLTNSPLANPLLRFGACPIPPTVSREFGNDGVYFGRFTQEETSFNGFRWPGVDDGAGNRIVDQPLVVAPNGVVAVDTNTNSTFEAGTDTLLSGSRAGEDILMTGVESFDIKVWDPGYGEGDFDGMGGGWNAYVSADDVNMNGVQDAGIWVDLGNSSGLGMFTLNWSPRIVGGVQRNLGNDTWGRRNAGYGPGGPTGNRVFDTWHPSLQTLFGGPPYQPLQVSLPSTYFWQPNDASLGVGSVYLPDIFGLDGAPGQAGFDDDGNTITDFVSPGVPDAGEIGYAGGDDNRSIGYIVVAASGATGPRVPEWSREPGALIRDGNVVWQCFDNRVGIEKIKITIRFRDPGSQQARQVTLVHSFVE